MKQAFLLKNTWGEIFNNLSDKQAGVLIKTLFAYNVNGEKPADLTDIEVKAYFNMMVLDCNAMKANYDRRCETSAINGSLGGARVGNQNAKKQPKNNLKQPIQPIQPDNENENENDLKKEKLKKEKNVFSFSDDFCFENVWMMYGKKGNKKTCERKWANLKNHCREAAFNHIPLYVQATPDKQFRKNFETYINQEVWNDEIIVHQKTEQEIQTAKQKPLPYLN